ncbi:DUF3060 domain-containing protein [Hymenobacter ruricola]|uniref:DUF3060 domain-containing protein n=1 Tax=Hymenobacter ruricola TaxID=2791023 RepID=A0ABS0IA89_9BACT|nr:DUF3060 domain-containing protein [Hymenobacter ruricola]MBF9223876.1 DUF3060 domain-containing protein [Hymenobacter ruricola]
MNTIQHVLLGVALAASLSACSQAKDEKEERREADSQRVEAPGMSIETKGDASTVVTSDENEIVIAGNKSVQSRACSGQDVQVQGDDNQATLTGTCKGLYIIGNRNKTTLENVATIQVTGDDNTVRWRGTEPEITNIGKGNTITKAD